MPALELRCYSPDQDVDTAMATLLGLYGSPTPDRANLATCFLDLCPARPHNAPSPMTPLTRFGTWHLGRCLRLRVLRGPHHYYQATREAHKSTRGPIGDRKDRCASAVRVQLIDAHARSLGPRPQHMRPRVRVPTGHATGNTHYPQRPRRHPLPRCV